MSEEIGLIYLSLSQLLDDICIFLRDGVTKEAFSDESKKQAETLIRRSKIQLQQISNLTNGECYMEMEEQKKVDDDEEEELIYMDAEEQQKEIPMETNLICPFAGVPAKDLVLQDKYGYISLKTKFIFGFEKLKRIFAAVHDDWFLIYGNDKDSKPCYTYSLRLHRARILPTTKQSEDKTQLFGLVNLETEQMLQFMAQTHKDMLQWITRINRYHQHEQRQLNKIKEPPTFEKLSAGETESHEEEDVEEEEEHYDMVILKENNNKNEEPLEEDEIYEVIRPPSIEKNQHFTIPKPSDLSTIPTKRQLTPLPPLPVEEKQSSESLASYDNPINMEPWDDQLENSETHSFSEDDSQEIYDVLVTNVPSDKESPQKKLSPNPLELPKEEALSPTISSIKEKLLLSFPDTQPKKEKPLPPKKLIFDKRVSLNVVDSSTKENQSPSPTDSFVKKQLRSINSLKSPIRDEFVPPSPNNSPVSPNGKGAFTKLSPQPKPSFLTKPKIDVKIIKSLPNTKSSTKQVMKLAKEISMK